MTRLISNFLRLERYIGAHRKALAGAVSTAVAAYGVQVANHAAVIDWRTIGVAVVAGVLGGGAVHQTTNVGG